MHANHCMPVFHVSREMIIRSCARSAVLLCISPSPRKVWSRRSGDLPQRQPETPCIRHIRQHQPFLRRGTPCIFLKQLRVLRRMNCKAWDIIRHHRRKRERRKR